MSAVVLKEVENAIKKELGQDKGLNDYFDLVAGTSTGSIFGSRNSSGH
ncbi:MAG: hypothetical protein HC925_03390 [Coleofasciculaceae cyanobacterium SM2_3_26]|nr:hypothetical protein [Coleofasciculaceae cyanobacterium SM2_3_26]